MSSSRPIALGFKILSAQKNKERNKKNGKKGKQQKWKETYS